MKFTASTLSFALLSGRAVAFVVPQTAAPASSTTLSASKNEESNSGIFAATAAALAGMTIASQVASASFTTLAEKAEMFPPHVLVAKAPEQETVYETPDATTMSEYKKDSVLPNLRMLGTKKDSNKFVATGAYHPETGYDSLDMSMPKYKIENSDLPNMKYVPKFINDKMQNKFVATGAYHPEQGYESLDMSMPKYKIENSDLPTMKYVPKFINDKMNSAKAVATTGAYHPETGYDSLDMSMPKYKIENSDLPKMEWGFIPGVGGNVENQQRSEQA